MTRLDYGKYNKTMVTILQPNIIDIEASGFGADSYPIEVGLAMGDGQRYCTLIKPHQSWTHWKLSAEQLHGISRSTIEKRGKSAAETCDELNKLLFGQQVFSDAWAHDERWLNKLFAAANARRMFELKAIEFIMCEAQYKVWDQMKQSLSSISNEQRHRASNDALLIQQTFIKSRDFVEHYPIPTKTALPN